MLEADYSIEKNAWGNDTEGTDSGENANLCL